MEFAFDAEQFPPRKISPFVVWLCTDAASNVNGRTFEVRGDTVSLLSEPDAEQTIHCNGGWDLDRLDAQVPSGLVAGLTNPYLLNGYPELKVFPD